MIEAWRTVAAAWWGSVAPNAIHVLVLGMLVAALDRLLPRRTWPEVRYGLWLLVLVRLIVPPALASPVGLAFHGAATPSKLLELATSTPSGALGVAGWGYAIVVVWLLGILLLAGHVGLRYRRLIRHWWRASDAAVPALLVSQVTTTARRLGLRRPPEVRMVSAAVGPFVVGTWRPTVYLPRDLDPARAEHALLHELGHLRRGDHWLAILCLTLQIIYWFHPLVWYAQRRLAALREQCCDRTVARVLGGRTAAYRRTLLFFLARKLDQANTAGLGFFHPRGALLERLRQLETDVVEPTWLRRATIVVVLVALTAVGLPAAQAAEQVATTMAELIERPPGCLTLRYLVLRRLAEQQVAAGLVRAGEPGINATGATDADDDYDDDADYDYDSTTHSSHDQETFDDSSFDPLVPRVRW